MFARVPIIADLQCLLKSKRKGKEQVKEETSPVFKDEMKEQVSCRWGTCTATASSLSPLGVPGCYAATGNGPVERWAAGFQGLDWRCWPMKHRCVATWGCSRALYGTVWEHQRPSCECRRALELWNEAHARCEGTSLVPGTSEGSVRAPAAFQLQQILARKVRAEGGPSLIPLSSQAIRDHDVFLFLEDILSSSSILMFPK